MKYMRLVLSLLALVPAFISAQAASDYLKSLEENGYCVIQEVLSRAEAEALYVRVWHEFVEKAWPNCKMDDRSNWKTAFPMHNPYGIFAGPAGQTQVMWDLRQDPRIVDVFAKIWNTHDLIASMDGLSIMCPQEIREGSYDPWFHVDQRVMRKVGCTAHNNNPPIGFVSESPLKTKPFTIQGQFLFEDSCDGDGGFYCVPKSHLVFTEFAPEIEALDNKDISNHLLNYFTTHTDKEGKPYALKHVTAKKGSLILWDSRTVHWNQHADKNRPLIEKPRVRMVGFISYAPKSRLTEEGRAMREKAFKEGISTGHNPAYPELKTSEKHVRAELTHYLEDPSFEQPKPVLTPLGVSLLGIE